MTVFLTGFGACLPGDPLDNDEVARRLGDPLPGLRKRIMAANGIQRRHLALDRAGNVTMLNEELAAAAVLAALKDRGLPIGDVGLLAAGTTQGDLLVPGFASMVHGRLTDAGPMEVLSSGGVCASSMAAFAAAARAIQAGDHDTAVVVGSELVSRSLRSREGKRNGDTEFLRWTLSDGAGAAVLQNSPRPQGLSLRLDWTHLVSYAHERPVCMSAGGSPSPGDTWLDPVTPDVSLVQLRQEVAMLPDLFRTGVHEFARLIREGKVSPSKVDHLLCHYSAERFRGDIVGLLQAANLMIDEERWFTNLYHRGNTGAASIFVMLEEAWRTGRFREGDRILLVVPESGRFSFAFAHLTATVATNTAAGGPGAGAGDAGAEVGAGAGDAGAEVGAGAGDAGAEVGAISGKWSPPAEAMPPFPRNGDDHGAGSAGSAVCGGAEAHDAESAAVGLLVLDLAQVWEDFERRLRRTAIVARIEAGTATVADYRRLLVHLRQQVVEGGRWISRAASNFSVELFDFRSAAIKHAADEHKDYRLLERDYVAVGGQLADIQGGHKNVGSEALSAFIFQQASLPDPVDLLGAMFIIEGLGNRLALGWARRLQDQLSLRDDQVSFLRYHGEADEQHMGELNHLLTLVDARHHARVVRTAQVVARLYALQLEEVN